MRFYFSKPLLFLFALCCIETAVGQYPGGGGKGEVVGALNSTSLDGNEFQVLYTGSKGQGSTVNGVFSITIDGYKLQPLYGGSVGKGETQGTIYAQSLTGENLNVLFVGGAGRGDQFGIKNSFALGGEAADIVYHGGPGRGDTALSLMQNALFDCAVQNMWNGKVSTAWEEIANWSCNELPGINSAVLIPSGITRYPILNASTEIRRLQINPGASVTVKANQLLKLNGQ